MSFDIGTVNTKSPKGIS